MEISIEIIIGLSVFFLLCFGFLWISIIGKNKKIEIFQKEFLEIISKDQAIRFRESESLRAEVRNTKNSLETQFHRVNKTVDQKLFESSKSMNDRLEESAKTLNNLQKELGKIGEIGNKIEQLDKIFRAPKGRGTMGEEVLEELLRSIFPTNLWERQFSLGNIGIVDAVVKTESGLLPIDAKYPLPAFEKIANAKNKTEQIEAEKLFEKDVKNRIKEVAKYIHPELNTLNFAILFLPNENIYYEAVIKNTYLGEFAKTQKVLLTGPNTMIYVLQVLFQAYQSQAFAKQAQLALQKISGVQTQAKKLDESLGVLTKHLSNASVKLSEVSSNNQKLQIQIDDVNRISIEKSTIK